jgi:steroid 5-alpha reductase family enzyme
MQPLLYYKMTEEVEFLLSCGAVSMTIGLLGFIRTIWFINLGYTLSIAAFCVMVAAKKVSVMLVAGNNHNLHLDSQLQLAILFIWAVRLGGYTFRREFSPDYHRAAGERIQKAQKLPLLIKIQIWWSVSFLYVCMFAPAALVALDENSHPHTKAAPSSFAGLVIMTIGLLLEIVADYQKSLFKQSHPDQCIQTGLYRWVCRHPNYLGEILVWIGNYVVGLGSYQRTWQWISSTLGLLGICFIMTGSTKRLEGKQIQRYGSRPSFQSWTQKVPVLVPYVPVYSLQKARVILE